MYTMNSDATRDHEYDFHDRGKPINPSTRDTSTRKFSRSTYIQRMQDDKAPQDPRKDRARVLGSVLNGDDDSLLFSVQESFTSAQPFVEGRNDHESRGDKSAIVSVEDKRMKTNLKVICDTSVDSPIVSLNGDQIKSNQKHKSYSAFVKNQRNLAPPLLETNSGEADMSDVDLRSIQDELGEACGRDSNDVTQANLADNSNLVGVENNHTAAEDASTSCGASLSVVLDDISIGGTTITSIREDTYTGHVMNDHKGSISTGIKETIDDVGSTSVIYDRDCDSTIKTETSQEQLAVVDDDDENGTESFERDVESKHYDNNEESIETVSMSRSVSWDPQVVTKSTRNIPSRTHARQVHSVEVSPETRRFLSSNPHLFAINEDSTGAAQESPTQTDANGSDDDDKDSDMLFQCKSAFRKVCRYPKLLLVICVVLLVIATIISAVFVSKDKSEDNEQNISSLRGGEVENKLNPKSSTPSTNPSSAPSSEPSSKPSSAPSSAPSSSPSSSPSNNPSTFPSMLPTRTPSIFPSTLPTRTPSILPSSIPSSKPSMKPSSLPSFLPTLVPTITHSTIPTITHNPSDSPSVSVMPTLKPSALPSLSPSLSMRTRSITNIISNSSQVSSSLDLSMEQSKALLWILYEDNMQIEEDNSDLLERYAMYLLYQSLAGTSWNDNESWLSINHVCDWKFVSCNENKRVYSLTLDVNNLKGTIPSEIGFFSNIESISFDRNDISGTIPSEIGQLSNLKYLSMKSNILTGGLPDEIFQVGIKYLDLSSNNLGGQLSGKVNGLYELRLLLLSSNSFIGSIPREIGDLNALETLHMTNNFFNGTIPSEIGKLKNLNDLRLKENSLSGQIPSDIGHVTELETFFVYKNKLTGELPEELYNLKRISDLRFFDNKISGTISSSIGEMKTLVKLAGHSNEIAGIIPSEIGMLTNLNLLYMYDNNLEGEIPKELSNLKFLQKLSFSLNKLGGTIPETLEKLTDLSYLSLWSNNLTGTVPSALGNLVQLTDLYLDGNSLQGTIPSSICALKKQSLTRLFSDCKIKVTCTCCTQCY